MLYSALCGAFHTKTAARTPGVASASSGRSNRMHAITMPTNASTSAQRSAAGARSAPYVVTFCHPMVVL